MSNLEECRDCGQYPCAAHGGGPAFTPDEEAELATVMQDDDLGRAVRVRWIDSGYAINGWQKLHNLPKDLDPVESVGLWMGENENVVMVGGTRDTQNSNWLNVQLIWKRAVVGKEWLDR